MFRLTWKYTPVSQGWSPEGFQKGQPWSNYIAYIMYNRIYRGLYRFIKIVKIYPISVCIVRRCKQIPTSFQTGSFISDLQCSKKNQQLYFSDAPCMAYSPYLAYQSSAIVVMMSMFLPIYGSWCFQCWTSGYRPFVHETFLLVVTIFAILYAGVPNLHSLHIRFMTRSMVGSRPCRSGGCCRLPQRSRWPPAHRVETIWYMDIYIYIYVCVYS